jgi:hypothetical protein
MNFLYQMNTTSTQKAAQEDGKEEENEGITRGKEISRRHFKEPEQQAQKHAHLHREIMHPTLRLYKQQQTSTMEK